MRISDLSSDVCSSDLPWYAAERDLPRPPYGQTYLYRDLDQLRTTYANLVERADLVIVGSYVPEGVAVGRWVMQIGRASCRERVCQIEMIWGVYVDLQTKRYVRQSRDNILI